MKTITIYCWKCGHKHKLADNGWNAILCIKCQSEILHPNESAQLRVNSDSAERCDLCGVVLSGGCCTNMMCDHD